MADQEQQATNRAASGAPGVITLGGTDYYIAQPGRADFVTLSRKLRLLWKEQHPNPVKELTDELPLIPKEYHALLLKVAVEAKQSIEPTNEALSALLSEVDGCRFWVRHLANKAVPGSLTAAQAKTLITEDTVDQVLVDLLEAGGLRDAEIAMGDEGKNSDGASG